MVTTLRDTQNYVRSAEIGLGVYEMPEWQVQQDLPQWQEVLSWLAERRPGQSSEAKSLAAIEPRDSEPERLAAASAGREAAPAPAALPPSMAVAGLIGTAGD